MNKKLIAIATAAALASSMTVAQASDVAVSGFADIIYNAVDDTTPANEQVFGANGEVDVSGSDGAASGRIDLDVTSTSSTVEQAYFSYAVNDMITVNGGIMNTPMGLDAQDAPNLASGTITQGQIFGLFESNIAGATADIDLGEANVTVGFLNDVNGTAKKNSLIIAGGMSPMEGLDVNAAFRTADDANTAAGVATTAGNAWDVNSTFSTGPITASAEIYGDANMVDFAYSVGGKFAINDMLAAAVRYDNVAPAATAASDTHSFTIAGSAALAENLDVLLEWKSTDDGTAAGSQSLVQAEAIVTFGDFE